MTWIEDSDGEIAVATLRYNAQQTAYIRVGIEALI